MAIPMTFNAFVQSILSNTLPFSLELEMTKGEKKYLDWISDNAQHLKEYSVDDFLEIYMEFYDIQENYGLSDYDYAMEMKAAEMERVELDKWLDIEDMVKDIKTFGYSEFIYNMPYDAW
jgi:hypothetical protein